MKNILPQRHRGTEGFGPVLTLKTGVFVSGPPRPTNNAIIPSDSCTDRFGIIAGADRSDCIWHCDQFVPGVAAGVDDVAIAVEDTVAEKILP